MKKSSKEIYRYIQSIRFGNLIILGLSQIFAWAFLLQKGLDNPVLIIDSKILLIAFSTCLIAAGGYIINDYHDVQIDLINKPEKVLIGPHFSKRRALFWYGFFSIIGIAIAFLVSKAVGLIGFLSAFLLWLYAIKLKREAPWGNLSIALLSAITLLELKVYFKPQNDLILWYALISFTIMLIREIIKDLEDQKGDEREHCKTLPIKYGQRVTKKVVMILLAIFVFELVWLGWLIQNPYLIAVFGGVSIAAIVMISKLKKADTIKDFAQISFYAKGMMVAGILSMIFANS